MFGLVNDAVRYYKTTTNKGGRAAGNSGGTIRGEVSRWEASLDGGKTLTNNCGVISGVNARG